MGVDAHIYLPGNVELDKVAMVVGRLLGLPAERTSIEENPPGFVRVPNATTRSATNQPNCAIMEFTDIPPPARKWGEDTFYFLYQFESSRGGDRVIVTRSNAFCIAIFKGLANFFGGDVLYGDCGEHGDYTVSYKSDDLNHPQDGPPFWNLQQRIFDLKPLTDEDFRAAEKYAAYKD